MTKNWAGCFTQKAASVNYIGNSATVRAEAHWKEGGGVQTPQCLSTLKCKPSSSTALKSIAS